MRHPDALGVKLRTHEVARSHTNEDRVVPQIVKRGMALRGGEII